MKIIESKELWLFSARKMNDSLDTNWINHLIMSEIEKRKENLDKLLIDKIIQNYNLNNNNPYLCCFSKDRDVLSQWRAYADDGQGVAIGFDESILGIETKIPVTGAISKITTGLCSCIYSTKEQQKLIQNEFDSLLHSITNEEYESDPAFYNFIIKLRMYSLIMKNPAFREENEIRIIHTPIILQNKNPNEDEEINLIGEISPIKFINRNNSISSYFQIPLENIFNSNLIPEIVLGPRCNYDDDFLLYLEENKLTKTNIIRSTASYRSSM